MGQDLIVLPSYTGTKTLDEAFKDQKSLKLLWLEILFNDSIEWEFYLPDPIVRSSYDKASIWYSHFRNMIERVKIRRPLKKVEGDWDEKEYRRFVEVLNFVAD